MKKITKLAATTIVAGGMGVLSVAALPGVAFACMKTLPFSGTTRFDRSIVRTQAIRLSSPTYFTFANTQAHLLLGSSPELRSATTALTLSGHQSVLETPGRSLLLY